jgi:hypothetical protein
MSNRSRTRYILYPIIFSLLAIAMDLYSALMVGGDAKEVLQIYKAYGLPRSAFIQAIGPAIVGAWFGIIPATVARYLERRQSTVQGNRGG